MSDIELPLTGHLEELRNRLGRSLLAIGIAFLLCYPQASAIFEIFREPLFAASAESGIETKLIGTGVAEAFFTRIKVSFFAAFLLALPVTLFEIWRFVVPGLKSTEAQYAKWFVFFGSLFFFAGSTFCYTIVFPFGFPFFLAEYQKVGVDPVLTISEYLSFSSRLLIAFGVTFEMPVAAFFLARAGVITHRTLLVYARYSVLILFVVAAVLTPPDAVSQLLMVGPLLLLYGVSILVAYVFRRPDSTSGQAGPLDHDSNGRS